MKLFRLRPNPDRDLKYHDNGDPYDPFRSYDITTGFVIRAESEDDAREIARENGSDELYATYEKWLEDGVDREALENDEFAHYEGIWTNKNLVECVELDEDGEEEVVMKSYKRG